MTVNLVLLASPPTIDVANASGVLFDRQYPSIEYPQPIVLGYDLQKAHQLSPLLFPRRCSCFWSTCVVGIDCSGALTLRHAGCEKVWLQSLNFIRLVKYAVKVLDRRKIQDDETFVEGAPIMT